MFLKPNLAQFVCNARLPPKIRIVAVSIVEAVVSEATLQKVLR